MKDGDIRMLGATDGYAHVLIWIRNQIGYINGLYAPAIHPRHVRKRAARDAILRPLKELERRLAEQHAETMAAYQKTRTTGTLGKRETS